MSIASGGRLLAGGLILILVLAACSGSGVGAAAAVAEDFEDARVSDPGRACDLLARATVVDLESDGQRCASVLAALGLPPPGALDAIHVFGTQAQAVFEDDVVFLENTARTWVVTAAGCTRRGDDLPYECQVSKG